MGKKDDKRVFNLKEKVIMYKYKAQIERVIDGDTAVFSVDLGFDVWTKIIVRFFGINAPETRTRNLNEKKAGFRCKEYVQLCLQEADKIEIQTVKRKKGKYGRYLATVFYNGINLNEELIDLKLAKKVNY